MTSSGRAPHVLVVEDDPSVRGLLQTLLSSEGYDVATASDGLACLDEAAAQRPALVLLDLLMPDLGGLRVLERMREDPALEGIPVVVVTGQLDSVPLLREWLGAGSVFPKPFSVTDLLERVAEITGGATGRRTEEP